MFHGRLYSSRPRGWSGTLRECAVQGYFRAGGEDVGYQLGIGAESEFVGVCDRAGEGWVGVFAGVSGDETGVCGGEFPVWGGVF